VVYAPKKGRYASFVGSLSDEALNDFLAGVLSGRIGTKPMSAPPLPADIDCTTFKRDGSVDGDEVAVEEDDTDMGDMMAEILADEKREREERDAKAEAEKQAEIKKKEDEKKAAAEAAAAEAAKKRKVSGRDRKSEEGKE
jgi:hypothetical protein